MKALRNVDVTKSMAMKSSHLLNGDEQISPKFPNRLLKANHWRHQTIGDEIFPFASS